MRTVKLRKMENGQHDIEFALTDAPEAVVQGLEIELGSLMGEWFADQSYGRQQELLQDKATDEQIIGEITRLILQEPLLALEGTVTVTRDRILRTMTANFTVRHVEDDTLLERVVNINGIN